MINNESLIEVKNNIQSCISDFNGPFTQLLERYDLPTQGVLAKIGERQVVINAVEEIINKINSDKRKKSIYLTRFFASVAAGLFDGAISYIWNETIKCIREMVVNYDLEYFFKIAEEQYPRYKGINKKDDLSLIGDCDLLFVCNRMGLISNHVFEIFKFINMMRNHASAAHPNENEIGAFDLLSWLDNCVKYVINAKPNDNAIEVKRLLTNIRKSELSKEDLEYISDKVKNLPIIMIDDLLSSIFGMYTDIKVPANVISNIDGIAKAVWDVSSEEKKHSIGERFGFFRKNGEVSRKERTDIFLTKVDGISYKDEDSLSMEIRIELANLRDAHNSYNNFYNEYPFASRLKELIPISGEIPESVIPDWVKTIVVCYCGNGRGYRDGVDERAVVYYTEFIKNFKTKEIISLLKQMDNPDLLMDFNEQKVQARFKNLCEILRHNTSNVHVVRALDFLSNHKFIYNAYKENDFESIINKL